MTRLLLMLIVAGFLAGCAPSQEADSNQRAANAPPAPQHTMDHDSMPSMARLEELAGADFDAAFAAEMIEHHQGAVEMSEEALKSATRNEVKQVARKIIADQEKEIAQMTGWVKEWTGKAPDPELRQLMKADMASMMSTFQAECATDCDLAFLTHMKTHHQMAVDMAEMVADKGADPDLKKLAVSIVASQSREIDQFDAWLKEWYSRTEARQ